jgi:hypothetical protein
MTRVRIFLLLGVLTGCAGLIGVPDLTFDEGAEQGNPDGALPDGATSDVMASDAGEAGAICDETKLQTDALNCGRCGHDCIGGACNAGKCEPVQLAELGDTPLEHIVEHGSALYVSTYVNLTTENGGIWKLGKAPGNPALFVSLRYAEDMVVLGDTLYFVVEDGPSDGAGKEGGLYSCDLNGPTPCVPKLIAAADSPRALAVDQGSIYYTDFASTGGIMKYTPPAAPVVFRFDWRPTRIWVDNESVYYAATLRPSNPDGNRAALFDLYPDAGDATELTRYEGRYATAGALKGSPNALYFAAFDAETTTGGVVRRVSRPGTPGVPPCDYAPTKLKRPRGIHLDATRIYWTNLGDPAEPHDNGSIAYCEKDGCCTEPTTHWTGSGQPYAITGDDKGLYWVTNERGTVWKVAKP